MNPRAQSPPMMMVPTEERATVAVEQARRMFARTLSSWTQDVLVLRRSGVDRLVWSAHSNRQSFRKAA